MRRIEWWYICRWRKLGVLMVWSRDGCGRWFVVGMNCERGKFGIFVDCGERVWFFVMSSVKIIGIVWCRVGFLVIRGGLILINWVMFNRERMRFDIIFIFFFDCLVYIFFCIMIFWRCFKWIWIFGFGMFIFFRFFLFLDLL